MGRDADQAGSELGSWLISASRTIHAQEHFLRQLLGYCMILHHPEEKMNDRRAMFLKQSTKARTISIFHPEHQFRVEIQSCGSRAYICPNPFGHSRLLCVPKYLHPGHFFHLCVIYSPFSDRSIKHRIASCGEAPACNIWNIWLAIGISTPYRAARSTAASVGFIPSPTIFIDLTISSSLRPRASSIPTVRFRLRSPVQVNTRSPKPVRPDRVCALPPMATARRVISASPRVMSAAIALCPSPIPCNTPSPMATTFLIEPPTSTPIGSELGYTRNVGPEKAA